MKRQKFSPDKAKALLKKERSKRIERCQKKLEALMKEENCRIDVAMLVTLKGNLPQMKIIALD